MIKTPKRIKLKIDQILEYNGNPKLHPDFQVEEIKNSIDAFGLVQDIVVNSENVIIIGHGRLQALKQLNEKEIEVYQVDYLDVEEQAALRIADNKINMNSGFDEEKMKAELNKLSQKNIELTGFNFDELKIIQNIPIEIDDEKANEEIEIPKTTIIKEGDLIYLGKHKLLCGDSTKEENYKKLFGDEIPVLMVTDPPYGVNYDAQWREKYDLFERHSKGKVKNDNVIDWSDSYKLFKGDIIYIWHAGKYSHIIAQNLIDLNYEIISQIIWVKQHFVFSRGDYHWQHEPCLYAVKKGQKHNWQGDRTQTTVWQIKNNNSFGNSDKEEVFGHGTQKPILCMEKPILNNSAIGNLIYDPFLGSGTTIMASEKNNRICYGLELDPLYCQQIIDRYMKIFNKSDVFVNDIPYQNLINVH